MKMARQSPLTISPRLNTIASCETPSWPSSDTQWFSGEKPSPAVPE